MPIRRTHVPAGPRARSGLAVVFLALAAAASVAVAAAAPPLPTAPRAHTSTSLLPADPLIAPAAVWDTLAALERRAAWAASESVSVALLATLESAPRVDSLALSRALVFYANSRIKRRLHADGQGFAALERAIGIRKRQAPRGDLLLQWSYALAATFYGEGGNPARAVALGDEGLALMRSTEPVDSSIVSQTELGRATALVALGRANEARAAYESALLLRERMLPPGNRGIIAMRAEYGLYLSRLGEFDAARRELRRAIADCAHDPMAKSDLLEGCLSRLSSVENRAGNLAESFDLAQRAWARSSYTQGPASVSALRMRIVVAYRLMDFGDYAGAAGHLRAAAPGLAAGIGEKHPQTLNARMSLVESLLLAGDTLGVRGELAAVRAGLVGQESFANSNAAFLGQLAARLELASGRPEAARESLHAVTAREWAKRDPSGGRLGALYVELYEMPRDSTQRDQVTRWGDEVERLADSTFVPTTAEWPRLVAARAWAEARVGLRETAWVHGLEAERLARERLEYQVRALPDERALQLAHQFGATAELLVALARPDDEEELAVAWDRVVRWRGLVRDEIASRRPIAAAATDTAVAAAHRRWLVAQRHLAQLVVSGAADPADSAGAAHLAEARHEAETAERAYARATQGAGGPREPADLARVLAALRPGEALVAFAVARTGEGDGTLAAFVARADDRRPRRVSLGAADVCAREVAAWLALLSTPPAAGGAAAAEGAARRAGRDVRARIWDPVAAAIGDAGRVHIVGEGPVVDLPWLALPGRGRTYLAEESRTLHVLSAERDLLRRAAAEGPADAGRGLLAVGDPDFGAPDATPIPPAVLAQPVVLRTRPWPCDAREKVELPPLPAARAEVEELARAWPASEGDARLLTGAEAGETEFKQLAPGRAVIHVASHGVVFADECADSAMRAVPGATALRGVGGVAPLATGGSTRTATGKAAAKAASGAPAPRARPWMGRDVWLALAGAGRPLSEAHDENEGLLTAEEVITLDLRGVEWVVLSACQSGVGPAWAREGVLGMRRAFHLAGARTVIASHWPVADRSTQEWMLALYAARARGASAGEAVAAASCSVLAARRTDGRTTHPFYWAAFSASGE